MEVYSEFSSLFTDHSFTVFVQSNHSLFLAPKNQLHTIPAHHQMTERHISQHSGTFSREPDIYQELVEMMMIYQCFIHKLFLPAAPFYYRPKYDHTTTCFGKQQDLGAFLNCPVL